VTTKRDFTVCGGLMWGLACVMLGFSFFAMFFGPTMRLIYCTFGVMVFAVYLVFDTQLIVGGEGRSYQLNQEDYILGAIILYMDIINLFIYILEFLMRLKND
jgi:FtsH-binding integral membrane protein